MTGKVLVDTGPIVAILAESDLHHKACMEQTRQLRGPLLTCWPVITEAAWLLRAQREGLRRLLELLRTGLFEIASLGAPDLPSIAAILAKYQSLGIQLADAALLHLANREGISVIFTLDRRDFSVLRLTHGKKLHLIP